MAEEFHAGICGGTRWNPSKTMFAGCSSPCSMGISDFEWGTDMVEIKARSCEEPINSVSDQSSMLFLGAVRQRPDQQADNSDSDGSGTGVLIGSSLQMMGFGISPSTTSDWSLSLLARSNGRTEGYNSILQEDFDSRFSCRQETAMDSSQIQKDWSPMSYKSACEDSSITSFKPIDQDVPLSCGISAGFRMTSASYGYPSALLQSLFEPDPQPQQQSLFNNNRSINHMSAAAATATYGANAIELLSPSWQKPAPLIRPSLPKDHQHSGLHFSNNTPFWNASAAGINDVKAGFLLSTQETNIEEVRNSGTVTKKGSTEPPPFKRPRIETPSPLPTFKVRKEKLGDRITALQQLVSPFGKTDTASVLHEAIEYIKHLHDQVNVFSTPYMKQAAASMQQQQSDILNDPEGPKQDLRSRGLCLVPISSTFPVANVTTADFGTPTLGGTFR